MNHATLIILFHVCLLPMPTFRRKICNSFLGWVRIWLISWQGICIKISKNHMFIQNLNLGFRSRFLSIYGHERKLFQNNFLVWKRYFRLINPNLNFKVGGAIIHKYALLRLLHLYLCSFMSQIRIVFVDEPKALNRMQCHNT